MDMNIIELFQVTENNLERPVSRWTEVWEKKPLRLRRQTGKGSVAWFFTGPQIKTVQELRSPSFLVSTSPHFDSILFTPVKTFVLGGKGQFGGVGHAEVWPQFQGGQERLAEENHARTPRPWGSTADPQLPQQSSRSWRARGR